MSLLKYMADMVLCILTAQLFKPEFRPMRTLLVSNWETQEAHWPAPDRFYPQRLYVVKDKVSICVWIYLWAFYFVSQFCFLPRFFASESHSITTNVLDSGSKLGWVDWDPKNHNLTSWHLFTWKLSFLYPYIQFSCI